MIGCNCCWITAFIDTAVKMSDYKGKPVLILNVASL